MKLERLSSASPPLGHDAARRPHAEATDHWHIDALDGTEADRGHSLQQELALADERAAPVADAEQSEEAALGRARAVAEELTALGAKADGLLRANLPRPSSLTIDDRA